MSSTYGFTADKVHELARAIQGQHYHLMDHHGFPLEAPYWAVTNLHVTVDSLSLFTTIPPFMLKWTALNLTHIRKTPEFDKVAHSHLTCSSYL